MRKNWINWLLAILITLGAVYFQRRTGPTHPKNIKIELAGETYKLRLLRTHGGDTDCELRIPIPNKSIEADLFYKKYPTNDDFIKINFRRDGDDLVVDLPHQLPAGKLAYYITFSTEDESLTILEDTPVVIRFKGGVPSWIVIIHVLLMFSAMLFSNVAAFHALGRKDIFRRWAFIAFGLLLIGGMIFGPLMQKYAFGEYWTGFPFGLDLTDNKTLIAFIFWTFAIFMNLKKRRPVWVIVAAVVMLLINSIPHSFMGSELDHETQKVMTGATIEWINKLGQFKV